MKTRSLCAIALAGLCTVTPLTANAAEYLVTYGGIVTDGSDLDNLFGLSGQDLFGQYLQLDVKYTTSVPGTRTTIMGSSPSDEVAGGGAFGTAPVISYATITLGSQSFTFSPNYYGDVYATPGYLDAYGYDTSGNSFQTFIVPDELAPADLEAAFASSGEGDAGGRDSQYSYVASGRDTIDFYSFFVQVSAVPEPASWALMISGFGLIGGSLRRRRKITTRVLFA